MREEQGLTERAGDAGGMVLPPLEEYGQLNTDSEPYNGNVPYNGSELLENDESSEYGTSLGEGELSHDDYTATGDYEVGIDLVSAEAEREVTASGRIDAVKKGAKAKKPRVYYVGMFSGSLSLVVMGIIFIVSLFTTGGMRNALKLSPLVLVFLGLELGANWYFRTGKRVRFDIRGYLASVLMIVIAGGLSALSVVTSNSDGSREKLESRYERELQNRISEDLSEENITALKNVTVSLTTYEEDISGYSSLSDIKDTDILEMEFYFNSTQKTLSRFSSDCRKILEVLESYDLPIGDIDFIADDGLNSVRVSVNGMFDMSISENEIARLAYYFAGDFHNDLTDYDDDRELAVGS